MAKGKSKSSVLNKNKSNLARPFLKWAGGKSQLLPSFQKIYPRELKSGKIKNYYEPFVGGGAVFFDIMQHYPIEEAIIYDINEELILSYLVIKEDSEALLDFLAEYQQKYMDLNETERKEYYLELRDTFNRQRFNINYSKYSENWISRAAQIIFLNKTCFNGLFRFNSKGEFNTPPGSYKRPKICDRENIIKVAEILKRTTIKKAGFEEVLKDAKPQSFIYFDPPYRPISKTSNFTSYSKHVFADPDQKQLAEVYAQLDELGSKIMLSNSDPKNTNPKDNFFDDMYRQYKIQRIPATRMINSKATGRGKINEIVVTNY